MARALIIGTIQEIEIKAAVKRARKRPIPWDVLRQVAVVGAGGPLLRLEDRGPEHKRPRSEEVLLPIGYCLCVSYEQQPAGLLAHFSISVAKRNALPNPEAVRAILAVAGFNGDKPDRGWVEEFLVDGEPGGVAVNLVYLVERAAVGHA